MNRTELILEASKRLLKVAEDIRSLADSVQAVCMLVTENLQGGTDRDCGRGDPETA